MYVLQVITQNTVISSSTRPNARQHSIGLSLDQRSAEHTT